MEIRLMAAGEIVRLSAEVQRLSDNLSEATYVLGEIAGDDRGDQWRRVMAKGCLGSIKSTLSGRQCTHANRKYFDGGVYKCECGALLTDSGTAALSGSQEHHCVQHGWYADRPCIHCAFADSRGT